MQKQMMKNRLLKRKGEKKIDLGFSIRRKNFKENDERMYGFCNWCAAPLDGADEVVFLNGSLPICDFCLITGRREK